MPRKKTPAEIEEDRLLNAIDERLASNLIARTAHTASEKDRLHVQKQAHKKQKKLRAMFNGTLPKKNMPRGNGFMFAGGGTTRNKNDGWDLAKALDKATKKLQAEREAVSG